MTGEFWVMNIRKSKLCSGDQRWEMPIGGSVLGDEPWELLIVL